MKALLNKFKSMPAFTLFVIIACWYLRWTQGLFPNGWDVVPLLVGMFAVWLLIRPEQEPSDSRKKWCKWLDHRYEYDRTTELGFTSDEYVCKRCGDRETESAWKGALPGMSYRKRIVITLGAIFVLAACALPSLAKDFGIYRDVVAGRSDKGFVSESWIERPLTRLMANWDEAIWSEDKDKAELQLISVGFVGGEAKFWRILQRKPAAYIQP